MPLQIRPLDPRHFSSHGLGAYKGYAHSAHRASLNCSHWRPYIGSRHGGMFLKSLNKVGPDNRVIRGLARYGTQADEACPAHGSLDSRVREPTSGHLGYRLLTVSNQNTGYRPVCYLCVSYRAVVSCSTYIYTRSGPFRGHWPCFVLCLPARLDLNIIHKLGDWVLWKFFWPLQYR
jgi:hypothetical protein